MVWPQEFSYLPCPVSQSLWGGQIRLAGKNLRHSRVRPGTVVFFASFAPVAWELFLKYLQRWVCLRACTKIRCSVMGVAVLRARDQKAEVLGMG